MEHNYVPTLPPEAVDPNVDGPTSHQPTLEDPTPTWVQHLFVPDAPSVPPGVPTSLLLPPSLPHPTELELAEADVRRLQTALAAAQNRLNGLRRLSGQGEAAQQCQPTSSPHPALRPARCTYCKKPGHTNFAGIGGCPGKYPCSICGDPDHTGLHHRKHGRRPEPPATSTIAERAQAPVQQRSGPASPAGSASPAADTDAPTQPEPPAFIFQQSKRPPAAPTEPTLSPAAHDARAQNDASPDGSAHAEPVSPASGAAAQGEHTGLPEPSPAPASHPSLQSSRPAASARAPNRLKPGWNAYGRRVAKPAHRQQDVPATPERSAGAQGEPTGHPGADAADRLPRFYANGSAIRQSHQRARDQNGLDKPDLFPYRNRPGCSRCGDQEPAALCYTPVLYADPTGTPQPDTYKNVALCTAYRNLRPTWEQTFTVMRVYHTVSDDAHATAEDLADDAAQDLADAAASQLAVHRACVHMRHVKYATGVKVPLNFAGLPRLAAGADPADYPAVTPTTDVPGRSNREPPVYAPAGTPARLLASNEWTLQSELPAMPALPATPHARPVSPPTPRQPDVPAPTDLPSSGIAATPTCPPAPTRLTYTWPALSPPGSATGPSPTPQPYQLPAEVLQSIGEAVRAAMNAVPATASPQPPGNAPTADPRQRGALNG